MLTSSWMLPISMLLDLDRCRPGPGDAADLDADDLDRAQPPPVTVGNNGHRLPPESG